MNTDASSTPPDPLEAALVVGRGARSTEAGLLADLAAHRAAAVAGRRLQRPTWIVVASTSQRDHLLPRIVSALGGAALGVEVKTLYQTALDIGGGRADAPRAEALFDVLLERSWRRRPLLAEALAPFDDAPGLAAATVRDLLDAGIDGARARAGQRRSEDPRDDEWLQAAAELRDDLVRLGVGGASETFEWAARRLERGQPIPREPDLVLIHGFAEATGQATRLLAALERRVPTRLYLDEPGDPRDPRRLDLGCRFVARLRRRFEGRLPTVERPAAAPPRYHAFRADGTEAEVRELAARVRLEIESGVAPEDIGVVARQLDHYAFELRQRFDEMGIPYSGGEAPASLHPALRRRSAFTRLLRQGAEAPLDLFDEVFERGSLRARTRAMDRARRDGARRLQDLAESQPEADQLRRRIADWPARAEVSLHLQHLQGIAELLLAPDSELGEALRRLIERWRQEMPALSLERDEFLTALERGNRSWCSAPMGGRGGGVQVLDAVEARGRTFARLFLLGLERDRFPRTLREDPLLSDANRRLLRRHLPELPLKSDGHAEERWLFAHLCSSAEELTLSSRIADDDGNERNPSPFLAGLPGLEDEGAVAEVPRQALQALAPAGPRRPRPAFDALLHAALSGGHDAFVQALPEATRRAAQLLDGPSTSSPARQAEVRAQVLRRFDRAHQEDRRLGPMHGIIGRRGVGDSRHRVPYVTLLEAVARCPYQALLRRVLAVPETADPGDGPPRIDSRILGNAVHAALQELIAPASRLPSLPDDLVPSIPRPSPARVQAVIAEAAQEITRTEGIPWPGFGRALARRAAPRVQAAIDSAWAEAEPRVAACERRETIEIARPDAEPWELRFRTDRIDTVPATDGVRVQLIDYKTGRPFSRARDPAKVGDELLRAVKEGRALQGAAYARVRPNAEGRYLFLRDDPEKGTQSMVVRGETFDAAFDETATTLLTALELGVFPPRLEDPRRRDPPTEPTACQYCEVRLACVRGDTGARAGLARVAERHWQGAPGEDEHAPSVEEELLAKLWFLGTDRPVPAVEAEREERSGREAPA